jgi:hypothetical protein
MVRVMATDPDWTLLVMCFPPIDDIFLSAYKI